MSKHYIIKMYYGTIFQAYNYGVLADAKCCQ